MTLEEFKERREEMRKAHAKEMTALAKECAMSNNPYEAGDVICDHIGAIKIESIDFIMGYTGMPECVYKGPELRKKDFELKKSRAGWVNYRTVYQSNIKS